jgi:type I restriction enzyme S subunit
MNRYEKYKPTTIKWIPEIPENWKLKKLKYTSYLKARVGWHGLKADEFNNDVSLPYCITGTDFRNGEINWENCYHISEERYNEDPYIQLKENDLLITKDGTIGKVAVLKNLKGKAILNSGIFVMRPFNGQYDTRYMYWLIQSTVFSEFINYTSKGSTIIHLYQDSFLNWSFALPRLQEQNAIANYLDEKTVQIDKLIANKQQLLDLLKEERTIIIDELIGRQEKDWKQKRLKYLAKMQGGFAFRSDDFIKEGIQLIKIGNLYQNEFSLERQPTYLPEDFIEKYPAWVVSDGDILMSMTGTLGKRDYGYAIQVPNSGKKYLLNQRVSKITFNESEILKEFGLRILLSTHYLDQLFLLPTGTKQGNFSNEQVLSIAIKYPNTIKEQEVILNEIKEIEQKFDDTVQKIRNEIELIQEYKTALISEVITGKQKVVN